MVLELLAFKVFIFFCTKWVLLWYWFEIFVKFQFWGAIKVVVSLLFIMDDLAIGTLSTLKMAPKKTSKILKTCVFEPNSTDTIKILKSDLSVG